MPLDTSTYNLALLRLDGRRWNELRRLEAQISTQASADGSSYLEMGNTKVICTISGPKEMKGGMMGAQGSSAPNSGGGEKAEVRVEVGLAGFSGMDRKRTGRNDKRITEIAHTISSTFSQTLFTHLYPHSTILISLQILSQDGSLLAACLNAATLALIDAGIPMRSYVAACTAGSTSSYSSNDEAADPLLDLNGQEELELPFLTVATLGNGEQGGDDAGEDKVCVCVMETRVQVGRLEGMLSVGINGCRQVRSILDGVVRKKGDEVLQTR